MSAAPPQLPAVKGPQVGLARGTLLVIGAEALAFPAGLAATILLTRHLPASQYGALALGLATVAWLEWTVVSLFSRAGYKLVAEAADWQETAGAVVRSFALAGLLVGLLLFAAAGLIAGLFGVPALTVVLRILAVEIPLFAVAQAYRTVLVGRGWHGSRATVAASRWTARALLIAIGVLLGLSLPGLAVVIVAATAVELALARWRVGTGVPLIGVTALSMRRLLSLAAPLAISAVCMRLFDRLDLFAIRMFGIPLETVAAYGVAQNLALAPGLLALAFVPALIAALSARFAAGDVAGAHRTATDSLRVGLLVLPAACLAAGGAPALVQTLFGADYIASGPLFAALVIGSTGALMLSLASAILVAAGRPRWTIVLAAPMVPAALLGHLLVIPRAGAIGAAFVTAATSLGAAGVGCLAVRRLVGIPLPLKTLARALVVGVAAYWAGASLLPEPGITALVGLVMLTAAAAAALVLAGELTLSERDRARRWMAAALRSVRSALA